MSDSKVDFAAVGRSAASGSGQAIELDRSYGGFGGVAACYRLTNGLRVVLMPDASAPIFAYQTWFGVGSKHEDPTRTGLAHLFEHLMFKGTANHPAGEFDAELERRGSETNAATWVDWTHYTEALASRGDNLETVVHFEVDRMTSLVLDGETFASELEVVKNERRMTVEDSVAGTVSETLLALAYRQHPYRWPTIGSMAHLEAATLEDLAAFYRTYYAPNNATVVLVGAVDPVAALTLLARSYGPLPAQSPPPRGWQAEPAQTAPRHAVVHRPVMSPQLGIGFHIPPQSDRDFAAVEMLAHILAAGDTGRLYRRLVIEEELATDVGGFAMPLAEPGLLELSMTLRAGVDPDAALRLVQQELDALSAEGVTQVELEKAQNGLELAALEGLRDVESRAEALGHFETCFGDFSGAFAQPAAYRAVDGTQLQRVASRVLSHTNRSSVAAVQGEADER